MDFKIAVLAGDGIGPEISTVGVDVMTAVCEKFGHKVNYEYAICGADAIDKVGDPFPEATYEACKNADAVLFSAVGDPKFDNDPTAKGVDPSNLNANKGCVDNCYEPYRSLVASMKRVNIIKYRFDETICFFFSKIRHYNFHSA